MTLGSYPEALHWDVIIGYDSYLENQARVKKLAETHGGYLGPNHTETQGRVSLTKVCFVDDKAATEFCKDGRDLGMVTKTLEGRTSAEEQLHELLQACPPVTFPPKESDE